MPSRVPKTFIFHITIFPIPYSAQEFFKIRAPQGILTLHFAEAYDCSLAHAVPIYHALYLVQSFWAPYDFGLVLVTRGLYHLLSAISKFSASSVLKFVPMLASHPANPVRSFVQDTCPCFIRLIQMRFCLHATQLLVLVLGICIGDAVYKGWKPDRQDFMKAFVHFGFKTNVEEDWMCGGVLITWKHILTAAHCDVKAGTDIAYVGSYNVHDRDNTDGLVFEIESVESSPDWKNNGYNYDDIAIVSLKDPSRSSMKASGISPIEVDWEASQWREYPNRLRVMGFGSTKHRVPASIPKYVRYGDVYTAPNEVCKSRFATSNDERKIICFDGSEGSIPCRGDSGGPVVYRNEDSWVLVGLISAGEGGAEACTPNEIWKATNIEAYKLWIMRKVGRYRRKELMGRI